MFLLGFLAGVAFTLVAVWMVAEEMRVKGMAR